MKVAWYKNVKFDSFAELANKAQSGTKWYSSVTLYYDGTNLYGDVTVDMVGSDGEEIAEFLKVATETLKF